MSEVTILIVEDELLIAKNLTIKLKRFGYRVSEIVSSGAEAIAIVNSHKPDLILMDIAIKGDLDGIETMEKIKEINDIPVIYLTAYADEKTMERAEKTGCCGYLLKPFKNKELREIIEMVLTKHRLEISTREYYKRFL